MRLAGAFSGWQRPGLRGLCLQPLAGCRTAAAARGISRTAWRRGSVRSLATAPLLMHWCMSMSST
jgi:hypothetical protein